MRRPRIGVPWRTAKQERAGDTRYNRDYLRAVKDAGGEPVQVSLLLPPGKLARLAATLDAMVLPGSPADVNPRRYRARPHDQTAKPDAKRENTDIALLKDAFAAHKPVLAICYGTQLLNVYLGGSLVQDIRNELDGAIKHEHHRDEPDTLHPVRLKGGRLARLARRATARVNSSHHQSIRRPGRGLRVTARAPDGVVEAVEWTRGPQWVVGVQWHPERMRTPLARALFSRLVAEARAAAKRTRGNPSRRSPCKERSKGTTLMKTKPWVARLLACLALTVFAVCPTVLAAQDPREMMPAASAAKAKELLEQAIAALGGPAYLNARDLDCKGTFAQFESSGAVAGYVQTRILRMYPDRERVELDSKTFITDIYGIPINKKGHHIVDVYAGDKAWSLNSEEGVSELGPGAADDYQEQLKSDLNMILRKRLSDGDLVLRYGGSDIVDIKQVDWVEITDRERRMIRIALDKKTHLPSRAVVTASDPISGSSKDTARVYSNYRQLDGIFTPMQISVFVNDRQVSQLFYGSCRFNSGLSPSLFTEDGLKAQFGGKKVN